MLFKRSNIYNYFLKGIVNELPHQKILFLWKKLKCMLLTAQIKSLETGSKHILRWTNRQRHVSNFSLNLSPYFAHEDNAIKIELDQLKVRHLQRYLIMIFNLYFILRRYRTYRSFSFLNIMWLLNSAQITFLLSESQQI